MSDWGTTNMLRCGYTKLHGNYVNVSCNKFMFMFSAN